MLRTPHPGFVFEYLIVQPLAQTPRVTYSSKYENARFCKVLIERLTGRRPSSTVIATIMTAIVNFFLPWLNHRNWRKQKQAEELLSISQKIRNQLFASGCPHLRTIILAHKSLAGGDCSGCITALEQGNGTLDLICNECGQRVKTAVSSAKVERELARLA